MLMGSRGNTRTLLLQAVCEQLIFADLLGYILCANAINRLVMHFIFYALTTTRTYNILLIYILKTIEINKFGRVFYTLW